MGRHGAPPPGKPADPATPRAGETTPAALRPRSRRAARHPSRAARLPVEPLAAAVHASGGVGALLRGRRRTSEGERLARAFYRALEREWITVAAADELACKLVGVHPAALWGRRFWVGAA